MHRSGPVHVINPWTQLGTRLCQTSESETFELLVPGG